MSTINISGINCSLILIILFIGCVVSNEVLSKCDFVNTNLENCLWNNSLNNSIEWEITKLRVKSNSSQLEFQNVLLWRSNETQTNGSSSYESKLIWTNHTVCLRTRYFHSTFTQLMVKVYAVDKNNKILVTKECNGNTVNSYDWYECEATLPTHPTDANYLKFSFKANINGSGEQFIAITDIMITTGVCSLYEPILQKEDNNSGIGLHSKKTKERIGPRNGFWVALMAVITLIAISVFVFIGISSAKKEHKKRHLQRSTSNNNNVEMGQDLTDGQNEEDDILFDDDFRIMPRSSFIMNVVRQISTISFTTQKSNPETVDS